MEDDIIINTLIETDWMNKDIEKLFIMRPKYLSGQLSHIKKDLEKIAQDPEYRF
jgi:hypothetical protein